MRYQIMRVHSRSALSFGVDLSEYDLQFGIDVYFYFLKRETTIEMYKYVQGLQQRNDIVYIDLLVSHYENLRFMERREQWRGK